MVEEATAAARAEVAWAEAAMAEEATAEAATAEAVREVVATVEAAREEGVMARVQPSSALRACAHTRRASP